jgi:two-component system CheB/CheR fusion protein
MSRRSPDQIGLLETTDAPSAPCFPTQLQARCSDPAFRIIQLEEALNAALREKERANAMASRLLRAVSHDLRQPLQTLALLQGLLAKAVTEPTLQALVRRVGETVEAMSDMLRASLEVTQPETTLSRPDLSECSGSAPDTPPPHDPESGQAPSQFQQPAGPSLKPVVFVIDDDRAVREAIRSVLEDDGRAVETFADGETFLEAFRPGVEACLLVDAYLPGMGGLDVLQKLGAAGHLLPTIMITGRSDVPMAVKAMKAGASDFIEKPFGRDELLASVGRALEDASDSSRASAGRDAAAGHVASLTPRQLEIMALVLAGQPSKNIAADLGISQRTVENHRASIMKRTGVHSLPALARLAVTAEWSQGVECAA